MGVLERLKFLFYYIRYLNRKEIGKLPKGLADKVLSTANDKIMQKRPSGG